MYFRMFFLTSFTGWVRDFLYIFLCALPHNRVMYSILHWLSIQVDSFRFTPFFRFETYKVMAKVSVFLFEIVKEKKFNFQNFLFKSNVFAQKIVFKKVIEK